MSNYTIDSLTYGSDNYTFSIPYGTCSTAAATAAKVVTCANFTALTTGARVAVQFTHANTADNPTLNVNNTGAKYIHSGGAGFDLWRAGGIADFIYNGTAWQLTQGSDLRAAIIEDEFTVPNAQHAIEALRCGQAESAVNAVYAESAGYADVAGEADYAAGAGRADDADYAYSAGKLSAKRTISLTGLVTGSATFDGSANCTISTKASTYLDALMTQNYCIAMGERVANTVSVNPPYLVADVGGNARNTALKFLQARPGISYSTEWYSDGYAGTQCNTAEGNYTITNNSPYRVTVYFYLRADWDIGDGVWITGMSNRISKELDSGEVTSGSAMVRCNNYGRLYNDYPDIKIEALGYDMSSTLG